MMAAHTYEVSAFPKEVGLRDGTRVILKPMTPDDAGALLEFFRGIPAEDRFYLKEDVTSRKVVERWVKELDYDRALPLLGWADDRVVADATLHRNRAGARRHSGEVRVLVAPEYRNRGLGTNLLRELAEIADKNGLERVLFEAVAETEEAAIQAAKYLGFVQVGVLTNFAKDLDGHPRDLVLLELPLGKWLEWWSF